MATDRMAELGGLGGGAEEGEPPATAATAAAPRPAQLGAGVVTYGVAQGGGGPGGGEVEARAPFRGNPGCRGGLT